MATVLQSVATRALGESTQVGHTALLALLSTLSDYIATAAPQTQIATAIERTRCTAARQASTDTYRLVIALASNVPRVEVVSRGDADPPEYVDVICANGLLFSLQRIRRQWFLLVNGVPLKLDAASFNGTLANSLVAFLRSA